MNCKSILLTTAYNNEEYYLSEWLDYHLKLGFSKIVIFEHDWSFPYKNNYVDKSVEFIPFSKNPIVNDDFDYINFDKFKNNLIHDYVSQNSDWDLITNFDCDEFLWLENYKTMDDFYLKNKDNPLVFVRWRHFGDNGLETFDRNNLSVLKRFTKCAKKSHFNGKTFITRNGWNLGAKWYSSHNVEIGDRKYTHKDYVDYNVELFHFRNKSKEESKLRFRPKVSQTQDMYNIVNQNEIDNFKARNFLYG